MRDQHGTDLVLVESVVEPPEQRQPIGEQLMEDLLAIEVSAKGGRPLGLARTATVWLCCCTCIIWPWV